MWVHPAVRKMNGAYPVGISNGTRLGSPHLITKGGQFEKLIYL